MLPQAKRADAGRLVSRRERVELCPLITECAAFVAPLAESRDIHVTCDLEPLSVTGDADRLSQAIANLLTNAIRYNRDSGKVDVSLRREEGRAVLTISDTGPGIPPQDQPTIFDRFTRVDKTRSRDSGGSGLGLAICKEIVEAHGGQIRLKSRPEDGASFLITLPTCPEPNGDTPQKDVDDVAASVTP
ncbi:MAG: HAMP domain-containing histidine kinase [Planctomycetia bacterium]|nr:HAMP domain-containing histidine kinase [Planctomycetia bacterium]